MTGVDSVPTFQITAIIVAIAVSQGALGADRTRTAGTGPWCWVDSSVPESRVWMLVTGKGWEILCYLLTSSLYVLLKFYLVCNMFPIYYMVESFNSPDRDGIVPLPHAHFSEQRRFQKIYRDCNCISFRF